MNRTEAVIIDLTSGGERKNPAAAQQQQSDALSNQPHYREISMVQLQAPRVDWLASPDLFDEMEPYFKAQPSSNPSQGHIVRSKL
ncbi:hypothetical protein BGW39_001088 [Mortierella sp. 14UC]|nr:hypothetical protein BGW39_001088 [Mortierella sp. 14UC]